MTALLGSDLDESRDLDDGEDWYERRKALIAEATSNVDFQLSYRRSPKPRRFHISGLTGPDIDDAFAAKDAVDPMRASGDWDDEEMSYGPLDAEGVRHRCFWMAINEAVHEALEWFQIDGRPALNPHGTHEGEVFEAVGELVDKLWAMRYDQPSHTFCLRVTGSGDDPTHIRAVEPDGLRRNGGRITGKTLCGLSVPRGWDLEGNVTRDTVMAGNLGEDSADHNPLCATCKDTYLAEA